MTKAEKEISNYIKARERDLRNGIVTLDEAAHHIFLVINNARQAGADIDYLAMLHKAFLMLARVTK